MEINQGRRHFLKRSCIVLGALSLHACGGGGGSSETSTPTTTTESAPTILLQPADKAVSSGDAAMFQVVAGGSEPLSYQWQRNGTEIPGANLANYLLGSTTVSDDGAQFRVLITNSAGTVISSDATLTVNPGPVAPTITLEPADSAVLIGNSATFQAAADGTPPLSYQWRRDGHDIPGATGPSFTIILATMSDNGSTFSVNISNQAGSVTSRSAILNVTSTGTTVDTTAIRVDTTLVTIDEV